MAWRYERNRGAVAIPVNGYAKTHPTPPVPAYLTLCQPLITHMFLRDRWSAKGDAHHQDSCGKEEDDGKVEVMDAADQARAGAGEEAVPGPINKFWDHPSHAHG